MPSEYPNLRKDEDKNIYFSLFVTLCGGSNEAHLAYKLTLLDQSGDENHETVDTFMDLRDKGPIVVKLNQRVGKARFISRELLERSSCLKNDCLKIECMLGVFQLPRPEIKEIMTPPSIACDLGFDALSMLETGEYSDVVFCIRDMKFRAHKAILLARSPVFRSMFDNPLVSEMVITGVEPQVFKALLHFVYSDTLPEDETSLVGGYAFGPSVSSTFAAKLLVEADKYDLRRLKSICESHLWRSISLNRFAETLMVAEDCNASSLKMVCFEYALDNYADLMELDAFAHLQKNYPLLHYGLVDYLSKKVSGVIRPWDRGPMII